MIEDLFGETPGITPSRALEILRKVVPKKSTLPILGSIKITSDGNTISMDGTDLDVWIHLESVDLRNVPKGLWLVDFSKLTSGVPLERLLEIEDDRFPMAPVFTDFKRMSSQWIQNLGSISYAMSEDQNRIPLKGVHVQNDGIVATDGHRLAFKHLETGCPAPFIVPANTVQKIERLDDPESCALAYQGSTENLIVWYSWGWVASKTIEEPYPNWKAMDRSTHAHRIEVPHHILMAWLNRMPKVNLAQIRLQCFADGVEAWTHLPGDVDGWKLGSTRPLPTQDMEPYFTIATNPIYLAEMVCRLPLGPVVIATGGIPEQALFLNPESKDINIQMPLRIK